MSKHEITCADALALRAAGHNRLCLIVPEFRVDGRRSGGLDAVAQFLLEAFTPANGWSVHVASPRMSRRAAESRRWLNPRSWLGSRVRDVVIGDVPVRYFGAEFAEFELSRYQPRAALTQYLDTFDAVLVVAGSPAIVNVASKCRRPVIAQIATLVKEERRSAISQATGLRKARIAAVTRLVTRLDEHALSIPRINLVENQHMLQECASRGIRAELIPPGIDCDAFHPPADDERTRTILAVGRWADERKDLPTLLRAFARSRSVDGIEHRLVLAGLQGPTVQDRALMDSLGIEMAVEIKENIPLRELADLYRTADLFALTSTEEGLGIVFLEAMASETPVIATATEGAKYAFGDSPSGELVSFGPELVDRFSAVLTKWCQDSERRRAAGVAGRRNVRERFDAREAGARFRRAVEDSLVG